MKTVQLISLLVLLSFISGCGAIATVFKGGMWFGVFLMVSIIAIMIYFLTRTKK